MEVPNNIIGTEILSFIYREVVPNRKLTSNLNPKVESNEGWGLLDVESVILCRYPVHSELTKDGANRLIEIFNRLLGAIW